MNQSPWLRDCWYVIAWSHEIPAAGAPELFSRTVLNEPMLVYRKADGGLVAMEDRCCHRLAPLSAGRREDDCIRCGYHGLKFAPDGACVEAPGIAIVPKKARVRVYPVIEKNRWVFVWPGDPAKADPALLPDNFSNQDPAWRNTPGYLHYQTPYLLICDNLLDFSHLSYVHEKTLGGSTRIAQAVPTIEKIAGPRADWPQIGIRVSRHVPDVPPPGYYRRFRQFDGNIDRWFIYDFLLPGTLLMHSGGRDTGASGDDPGAVRLHSCQTLTPETESTTHYFFQQAHRTDGLDEATSQSINESIYQSLLVAFEEDRVMITRQYRNILLNPAAPMLPLALDSALLQFRRLLEARVTRERQGAGSTVPA
ncbi:MAG: Rieske 2Fe-2S domain-containing protein [Lautropia sp.]